MAFDFRRNFLVKSGEKLDIAKIDPSFTYLDKAASEPVIEANNKHLTDLQMKLYAAQKESVLIVLQGMDAAGKDGVVTRIFGPLNPLGCQTHSFKVPSEEERAHDFLWRVHKNVPIRGGISIFNRSHYEAVLVERVHDLVPQKVWEKRYKQINDFEEILTENGTRIIKFFLHIDKQEQLERFKQRLDDPSKQWKISNSDYSEREYWDDYRTAYEAALSRTSQPNAPWYVIPANKKWFRNLAISQIIVDIIDDMKIADPKVTVDIAEIKLKYHAAANGKE